MESRVIVPDSVYNKMSRVNERLKKNISGYRWAIGMELVGDGKRYKGSDKWDSCFHEQKFIGARRIIFYSQEEEPVFLVVNFLHSEPVKLFYKNRNVTENMPLDIKDLVKERRIEPYIQELSDMLTRARKRISRRK